jgi:hypothetical protein
MCVEPSDAGAAISWYVPLLVSGVGLYVDLPLLPSHVVCVLKAYQARTAPNLSDLVCDTYARRPFLDVVPPGSHVAQQRWQRNTHTANLIQFGWESCSVE